LIIVPLGVLQSKPDDEAHLHFSPGLPEKLEGCGFQDIVCKEQDPLLLLLHPAIKNIYGTTPEQNKFREYHLDREVKEVTVQMLEEFPKCTSG
jgi:hypothetical protein